MLASVLEGIIAYAIAKGIPRAIAKLKDTRFGKAIGQSRLLAWLKAKASAGPLNSKSIVVDSHVVIALDKHSKGLPLQRGEQLGINRIRAMGDVELRVTDTTIGEMKGGKIIFRDISLSIRRSSPQYQALLRVLEARKVGGTKANAPKDRTIVADTFFAQTEPGITPKLATQDTAIYNNLALIAGIKPNRTAAGIAVAYPNGFNVTINGKTIRVIPIPKK